VVTEKKSNVLLVPNRAIHVTGGQRTVTVLFEGQQIPVPVQVGLSNDTQSEITGGQLRAGDTIVLNATTATTNGGGGFGGGPFGGFGRGG
jgi:macrolide-specific efflux system membrane fusion protein